MIKRYLFVIFIGMFVMSTAGLMANGNQKICPVMKGKVNSKIYVDYKDNRVFFCCAGCEKKFLTTPEEYLKKMADQGIRPMKLKKQSVCPVMGGKVNDKLFADVKGKRVYVCCSGCIAVIKKNPGKYLAKIAEKEEYPEDLKKN